MTLRDVFEAVSGQPALLFLLLMAVPTGAFLVSLWSGETAEEIWNWRYVYTVLIYLACIPGVFAVTLNVYLFLFERQSIWDLHIAVQVLPILTMITTLTLIRRKIPFNYIPGFGKLSAILTLITAIMASCGSLIAPGFTPSRMFHLPTSSSDLLPSCLSFASPGVVCFRQTPG